LRHLDDDLAASHRRRHEMAVVDAQQQADGNGRIRVVLRHQPERFRAVRAAAPPSTREVMSDDVARRSPCAVMEDTMLTATHSRADITLRENVVHQLEWDPEIDASAIGVTADDGAVTLSGFIDSYAGKLAAERAAKRVRGVRAVANELEVRVKLRPRG
jgi:osmotically-inducible protein OsmY